MAKDESLEVLGEVLFPSGRVLVVDTGLLNLWNHDRPPLMPEGILSSEEATASANRSIDYRIEGPDDERAGALFDHQWHPRFLFDIPAHGTASFEAKFSAFVAEHRLDAHLLPCVPRVSHLERARLVVDHGAGAGELLVHGVPMVAAGGLPARPLRVVGRRREAEPFAHCWSWVAVEVIPSGTIHRSVRAGVTGVDWARVMFVDPESLGAWVHDEPIDGLADFVFWGRDAEVMARTFEVPPLGEGEFGWVDLPVDEAVTRGSELEGAKAAEGWRLATDYRPHSHHYALLRQMRTSPTESGVLDLGSGTCCALFTTWGDGLFEVFRDLDRAGRLVRLRVQFDSEQALQRMNAVNGRD